jgi:chromosome segregation protein
MVERAAALAAEVARLEEAAGELDGRVTALSEELQQTSRHIEELRAGIVASESRLDEEIRLLDDSKKDVQRRDDVVTTLKTQAADFEETVKSARADLDGVRRIVTDLDIARATAESDLAHLAASAVETVQATLEEIAGEVAALEQQAAPLGDADTRGAEDAKEEEPEDSATEQNQATLTAEEAIARLRDKVERLGPVNMMAIEQFDELETRHGFLTSQRKDLVESISQTTQAIKRIDETTRQRFSEAFSAINQSFQETFTTLFGGGRAGLTLLDETDPLESGIEIVAQPPGKRLQSVQLLSGGEKALTAISLMFGLFKYKPSPFCLLDEIDAPLDDANISRFVEMLRSMQRHTQFILITHNRKTMEIADRLYGVTMEEPGVSKLISVQLN